MTPKRAAIGSVVMQLSLINNKIDLFWSEARSNGDISQYFVQWKNDHTIRLCSIGVASKACRYFTPNVA